MSVLMIIKDKKIEFKSESLFAKQKSFTFFVVKSDSKNIEMNVWENVNKNKYMPKAYTYFYLFLFCVFIYANLR